MNLKDRIINTKPRERSGSTSSSRFDYQKDWSICKLMESFETNNDYVMIFDWHDDLIIMDSEHSPQNISFYQIKGKKSGNWTIAQLIKSELDKNNNPLLSIIGKLYDCKSKFQIETTSLNFLSNARFNVDLEDNTSSLAKDNICIIELSSENKVELKNKIKAEHNLTNDPVYENITFLKVLDLSLNDSATHVKGKISDFLDRLFPNKKFHVASVYRMLFDEVKRRSSYDRDILKYSDLITNKAIGKSQFQEIIEATGINKNFDEIWIRAENTLRTDGLNFQELRKIKKAWSKLELERMNPNNEFLKKLIISLKEIAIEQENANVFESKTLLECIESIFISFNTSKPILLSYDDYFIKAIILSEIYE